MENYVIRIYRREFTKKEYTGNIWGIVEESSTGLLWSFENSNELWRVINNLDKRGLPLAKMPLEKID